jgi:hypothetical protein
MLHDHMMAVVFLLLTNAASLLASSCAMRLLRSFVRAKREPKFIERKFNLIPGRSV